LEIAKLKIGGDGAETYACARRARPGTRIEGSNQQAGARAETVGPLALAHAIAFRETEVCATLVGTGTHGETFVLGNAHPDRRNRRHHDRPRRDPRRRNHPSFRMASLHQQVFARAASCRCQALARTEAQTD